MAQQLNPSIDEADRQVIAQLDEGMQTDRTVEVLVDDFYDGVPGWYSRLLTGLALLVGGDEIQAAFPYANPETGQVRAVVLTPTRILDARTGTDTAEPTSTRTVSRHRVRAVSVESRVGVFGRGSAGWPGPLRIAVDVDGFAEPLTLPLTLNPRIGVPQPDIRAVLTGFLRDLDR